MKFFKAQSGSLWSFNDSETQSSIDDFALAHGVTLTPISAKEFEALTNPPPTLSQVVASKMRELAAAYAAEITGDIEYPTASGIYYQGDERTVQALESALRLWTPETIPADFKWWDADNQRRAFSYSDLTALLHLIDSRASALPVKLRDKKDEAMAVVKSVADSVIDEAQGVADVQSIEW